MNFNVDKTIWLHYGNIDNAINSIEESIRRYERCPGRDNPKVIERVRQLKQLLG